MGSAWEMLLRGQKDEFLVCQTHIFFKNHIDGQESQFSFVYELYLSAKN